MYDDFDTFTKEDFALTGRIGKIFHETFTERRQELLRRNREEGGLKKSTIIQAIMESLFDAVDWDSYCNKYIAYSEANDWEIQSIMFPYCDMMIPYILLPEPGDVPVANQPSNLKCSINHKVRMRREEGFLMDSVLYLFSNEKKIKEGSIPKRVLLNRFFQVNKEIEQLHNETNNAFIAKLNLIHRGFHASVYSSKDLIVNNKYSIGALITAFTVYEVYTVAEDAIQYKNGKYSISRLDVAPGAYVSYRYLLIQSETKRHFDKIIAFLESKPYLKFPITQVEESARKYFMDRDVSGFSLLNLFIQDNAALASAPSGHVIISLGEDLYGKFPQTEYFSAFLRAMNEWNHMGYDPENVEFIMYERGTGNSVNPEKRTALIEEQRKIMEKYNKRRRRQ